MLTSLVLTGTAGWFAFQARKIGRMSATVDSMEKALERSAASGGARDKLLRIETLIERSENPDHALKDTLEEIKDLVTSSDSNATEQLDLLRESLENLQSSLSASVTSSVAEAQSEVAKLATKIGETFASQASLTEDSITSAFSDVLSEVATGSQLRTLTDRLTEEFRSAMRAMGSYQEISITNVASATLEGIGDDVGEAIRRDVSEKLNDIETKVDNVGIALESWTLRPPELE